ncbi:hypothetical protein WAI453_006805 [Rhynchosporium graminicola]
MMPLRSHPYLIIGCVVASALLLISLRGHGPQSRLLRNGHFRVRQFLPRRATSDLPRWKFGFQKILVIGLPERSDKRDQPIKCYKKLDRRVSNCKMVYLEPGAVI